MADDANANLRLLSVAVKEARRKKLEELYMYEEKMLEAELNAKGLAYRRERY